MQCPSCGTTLSPGTTICPRCGTNLSYTSDSNEVAYVEYGPVLKASVSTPPAIQSASMIQRQSHYSTSGLDRPAINDGLQTHGVVQQSPLQPPPSTVQLSPVSVPQKEQQGFSAVRVMLLAILILMLAIDGSGLIYFTTILHPGELHIQATTVAKAVLTTQAQSTAEANVQATATAASLTPQQIYLKATSGTPIINDQLSDRNNSIWYHGSGPSNSCDFVDGAYHLRASVKGILCPAYDAFFKNLAFQVQMKIIEPGTGGLSFDINSGYPRYYFFFIDQTGGYSLYVARDSGLMSLVSGSSSAINLGLNQSNLLSVVAFDGHIYLYVNKQLLAHTSDSTYTSGQIGLFAENDIGPSNVAFNNAQVWSI